MEDLRLSPEKEGVTEYVFAWIFAWLVKSIHVELSDEAVDVSVSKIFGEYLILKLIYLLDGKLTSVDHPVNDCLVLFVFQYLKTFLNEVGHWVFILLLTHFPIFLNFYSFKQIKIVFNITKTGTLKNKWTDKLEKINQSQKYWDCLQ